MKLAGLLFVLTCIFAATSATGTANVRFLNACTSPSSPLTLKLGSLTIPSISLGVISAYVQLPIGTITLSVLGPDGKLISLDVNLQVDTFYTVVVVGDKLLSLKVFVDNVAVAVDASLLRVVLLGNLNVDLNVFLDVNLLGLLKASADLHVDLNFQKIITGNVTLAVKNLLGLNIFANVFVALPGKAYTAYLIPSISDNAILDVVLAVDVAVNIEATVKIRLLHAFVPLLGKLDLVVDGKVVISGVVYADVLAYVSVNIGAVVNIQVRLAGTLSVLVELKTVTLIAGHCYTLCVFGESKPFVQLLLDTVLTAPADILFRVVHLAESLLLPQVVSITNQPLLNLLPNPVKFKDITNFIAVIPKSPLSISIATSLDIKLVSLDLNINIGGGTSVCIIGSKYSLTRPLKLLPLDVKPGNVYLDPSLAIVHLNLNLLGIVINLNVLGLLGLRLIL